MCVTLKEYTPDIELKIKPRQDTTTGRISKKIAKNIKKIAKTFGGIKKPPYICNRNEKKKRTTNN